MPTIRIETESYLYSLLFAGYTDEEIRSRLHTSFATIHKYRERVSGLLVLNTLVRRSECPRCKSPVMILQTMASARCPECQTLFDLPHKADLRSNPTQDPDD